MPELRISYKNPKVKEALTDFSKYLDFKIISNSKKKVVTVKSKKENLLIEQIEKGLTDVKKLNKVS
ncbi:MAG: hypothetical protein WDM90_16510 [Ferruginibacter sp.]